MDPACVYIDVSDLSAPEPLAVSSRVAVALEPGLPSLRGSQ